MSRNRTENPSEWRGYRRDGSLLARARGRGHLTGPRVAWSQFVGHIETFAVCTPAGGDDHLPLPGPAKAALTLLSEARWGLTPPAVPLAGVPHPLPQTFTTTHARLLPNEPDPQRFEFVSSFAVPTVNGAWGTTLGHCSVWRDGDWHIIWQTEPLKNVFEPLPLTGDFDGDGRQEIAILPWHELVILDGETGAIKDRCHFTSGRSYGSFSAYDLNGDGLTEFVVQADFAKHIEVLGYRQGKLALLWQREIELDISYQRTVMRVLHEAIGDVDGDGRPELVVNLYNVDGDERWHLVVHDALDGRLKADVPDFYAQHLLDVDGDGRVEVLAASAIGYQVPSYGGIAVLAWQQGGLAPKWQRPGVGWQTADLPLPGHINSAAVLQHRCALARRVGARSLAVWREPASAGVRLALADLSDLSTEPAILLTMEAPDLVGLALAPDGALLVRSGLAPEAVGHLVCHGGQVEQAISQRAGIEPGGLAVAWLEDERRAVLVTPGDGEELVVWRLSAQGCAPRPTRLPGRGQTTGWTLPHGALHGLLAHLPYPLRGVTQNITFDTPVLADLRGDGSRQVLYATQSPTGCARMVASELDGHIVWQHDFPGIPGDAPLPSVGGLIFWQTGHLTSSEREDVLVTVRRSMMHSEETWLLAGTDGHVIWRRDRQPTRWHSRAVGGTPFALADYDGDGLDEVASFHPSNFYILDGHTGANDLAMNADWPQVPCQPVYWGIPIAGPFEYPGRPALFFGTDRAAMTGLVRADGSLVWWDALDISPKQLPALGDFDGDGRWEAIGWGYPDGIRCYDAASGTVHWTLPIPEEGVPAGVASGDLDGDGRDEALFALNHTLYCLGCDAQGMGEMRWQQPFHAEVGMPCIAALDSSGELLVFILTEDGYVHCLGPGGL